MIVGTSPLPPHPKMVPLVHLEDPFLSSRAACAPRLQSVSWAACLVLEVLAQAGCPSSRNMEPLPSGISVMTLLPLINVMVHTGTVNTCINYLVDFSQ